MNEVSSIAAEAVPEPVTYGVEAFTSEDYARAEPDRLWRRIWQQACRIEEIPKVGDYVTYDIVDDTIIIVRSDADTISAFYNVCAHRGRKLVDGCGHAARFHCKYHAWQYNLKGENTRVLDKEDWNGALDQERLNLPKVKVDTWGGWVWINMDPDSEPLSDYLKPAAGMLDPFELDKMRFRWRQWAIFDCNWKVAQEAFMESYHVEGTHPQFVKYADFYTWSKQQGLHSNHGFEEKQPDLDLASSNTIIRAGRGEDARVSIAQLQIETLETVNSSTTQTFVDAAVRLVDELPEGTPPDKVMEHWLTSAKADDAARGVIWPEIDPEHMARCGIAWHVFPNLSLLFGHTFALYYRARPYGADPDRCFFDVAVLERFPEGGEPNTEWTFVEPTDVAGWRSVLVQDFENMTEVQRGMKSRGFRGALPNPKQEQPVINLHQNLAKYMGLGQPQPLKADTWRSHDA